jgi:hypothetical protein
VICSSCWVPELHEGTEWKAYRISGGMCDVGDPEAIDPRCWPEKYRRFVDGSMAATSPADSLEDGVRQRVQSAAQASLGFVERVACELVNAHDYRGALHRLSRGGTSGGLHPVADAAFDKELGAPAVRPTTRLDQGATSDAKRPMVGSTTGWIPSSWFDSDKEQDLSLVLHDDDYHTYSDVTDVLTAAAVDSPSILTERVDSEGDVPVASYRMAEGGGIPADITRLVCVFAPSGLLLSLESAGVRNRTEAAIQLAKMLCWLTSSHDGIADLIAAELVPASLETDSTVGAPNPEAIEPLRLLMLADAYLSRDLRGAMNELYSLLLRRPAFRRPFATCYAAVVTVTGRDWCRGIGSSKGSFHENAVQALTTPSVSRALTAGMGAPRAFLHALALALEDAAAGAPVGIDLQSVMVRHKRYRRLFADFECLATSPGTAQHIARDPLALAELTKMLGRCHSLFPDVKRTGDAAPFDDNDMVLALNLALNLQATIKPWLAVALGPSCSDEDAQAAHVTASIPSISAAASLPAVTFGDALPKPASWMHMLLDTEREDLLFHFAAEAVRIVRLAQKHGTSHPLSRGEVFQVDPALARDRERGMRDAMRFIQLGIPVPADIQRILTTAVTPRLVRRQDPVPDISFQSNVIKCDLFAPAPSAPYALGGPLEFDLQVASFDVDSAPVSLVAPLHAAFGIAAHDALLTGAARVSPPEALNPLVGALLKVESLAEVDSPSVALLDYPLRALAVARRKERRMWIRNGQQTVDEAVNFLFPPQGQLLSEPLRACLSAAVAGSLLTSDQIVALVLDRFGCAKFLLHEPSAADLIADKRRLAASDDSLDPTALFAQDALSLLAHMVADAPVLAGDPKDLPREIQVLALSNISEWGGLQEEASTALSSASVRAALRREALHLLAQGPRPRSEIDKLAAAIFRRTKSVPTDVLDQTLEEIASYRPPQGAMGGRYVLLEAAWAEVDFFHPRLQPKEVVLARDEWTTVRDRWRGQLLANRPEKAMWGGSAAALSPAASTVSSDASESASLPKKAPIAGGMLLRYAAPTTPCPPPCLPAYSKTRSLVHSPALGIAIRSILRDFCGGLSARVCPGLVSSALNLLALGLYMWPSSDKREIPRSGKLVPTPALIHKAHGWGCTSASSSAEELDSFVESLLREAPTGAAWPVVAPPPLPVASSSASAAATPVSSPLAVLEGLRTGFLNAIGAAAPTVSVPTAPPRTAPASPSTPTAVPAAPPVAPPTPPPVAPPAPVSVETGPRRVSGSVVTLLAKIVMQESNSERETTEDVREAAAWCLRAMREVGHARLRETVTRIVRPMEKDAAVAEKHARRSRVLEKAKALAIRRATERIETLQSKFMASYAPLMGRLSRSTGEGSASGPSGPEVWSLKETDCIVCRDHKPLEMIPLVLTGMAAVSPALLLCDAAKMFPGGPLRCVVGDADRPSSEAAEVSDSATVDGMLEAWRRGSAKRVALPAPTEGGGATCSVEEEEFSISPVAGWSGPSIEKNESLKPFQGASLAAWRSLVGTMDFSAAKHRFKENPRAVYALDQFWGSTPPRHTSATPFGLTVAADVHAAHAPCVAEWACRPSNIQHGGTVFDAPLSAARSNVDIPLPLPSVDHASVDTSGSVSPWRGTGKPFDEPLPSLEAAVKRALQLGLRQTKALSSVPPYRERLDGVAPVPAAASDARGSLAMRLMQLAALGGDAGAAEAQQAIQAILQADMGGVEGWANLLRTTELPDPDDNDDDDEEEDDDDNDEEDEDDDFDEDEGYGFDEYEDAHGQFGWDSEDRDYAAIQASMNSLIGHDDREERHRERRRDRPTFQLVSPEESLCLKLEQRLKGLSQSPRAPLGWKRWQAPEGASASSTEAAKLVPPPVDDPSDSPLLPVHLIMSLWSTLLSSAEVFHVGVVTASGEVMEPANASTLGSPALTPLVSASSSAEASAPDLELGPSAVPSETTSRVLAAPPTRKARSIGALMFAIHCHALARLRIELLSKARKGGELDFQIDWSRGEAIFRKALSSHHSPLWNSLQRMIYLLALAWDDQSAVIEVLAHSFDAAARAERTPCAVSHSLGHLRQANLAATIRVAALLLQSRDVVMSGAQAQASSDLPPAPDTAALLALASVLSGNEEGVTSALNAAVDRSRCSGPDDRAKAQAVETLQKIVTAWCPSSSVLSSLEWLGATVDGSILRDAISPAQPLVQGGLLVLPHRFDALYTLVLKAPSKSREKSSLLLAGGSEATRESLAEDSDDSGDEDRATLGPALCLATGTVVTAAKKSRGMGECSAFSKMFLHGTGVFLLVRTSQIVLIHDGEAADYPSIYVDKHGEADPRLERGVPLSLSLDRYSQLVELWARGGVPREVSRLRRNATRTYIVNAL